MPRARPQRKRDAIRLLEHERDLWIATARSDGTPYLLPLSFSWDGRAITLVSSASSPTFRNLATCPTARLAVGSTRDVVMIDVELETVVEIGQAERETLAAYERQAGWSPNPSGNHALARLRPLRIQVWREADEIEGRTVMSDGKWLEDPQGHA